MRDLNRAVGFGKFNRWVPKSSMRGELSHFMVPSCRPQMFAGWRKQVTKSNKTSAETADIRKNDLIPLIVRRASINGPPEAKVPLGVVATLTGFEPVLLP